MNCIVLHDTRQMHCQAPTPHPVLFVGHVSKALRYVLPAAAALDAIGLRPTSEVLRRTSQGQPRVTDTSEYTPFRHNFHNLASGESDSPAEPIRTSARSAWTNIS